MKSQIRWIVKIVLFAVIASSALTFASATALSGAGYAVAFAALALFIVIGIAFDIVGVAVISAREAPFHAMSSHKERGAKQALRLIRSAEKVSSICSDVAGDIAGILTGTTAALVAERLSRSFGADGLVFTLLVSGAVTALTIGGKAMGKSFALRRTNEIILFIGKFIGMFQTTRKRRTK